MFDFINLTLQEFIRKFNCEDVCLSYLEERFWNNIPVSPFDPFSKVYKYGNHKYRCRNTGKNFNVKTNTLFHGTKVSEITRITLTLAKSTFETSLETIPITDSDVDFTER